jgi:hypothetical protein
MGIGTETRAREMPRQSERGGARSRWLGVVALTVLVAGLVAVPGAGAKAISTEEKLALFGGLGEAAGKLNLPSGVASDPVTGHVYAAENGNNRISEFTPLGTFVKAFGWDVAPGAVNEQQEVRVKASEGGFELEFEGEATAQLPFDANEGEVETALSGLAKIGGGGVEIEAQLGASDGVVPNIYVTSFKGSLAGTNVPQLEAVPDGMEASALVVRTRADGHGATTGLESCTAESGCKAGIKDGGAGEFHEPRGIAVDEGGDVFVVEVFNHRVQEFDSAGRFVLMLGGEVDKTTSADICTKASGDECGVGVSGTGNGEFSGGGGLAICLPGPLCPEGSLFVGDKERIQIFNLKGEWKASIPLPGETAQSLAFDPTSGDLWVGEGKEIVPKLDQSGKKLAEVKVNGAGAVATDTEGDLFVGGQVEEENAKKEKILKRVVLEFDSEGKTLNPQICCEPPSGLIVSGLGTNSDGDLYAAYSQSGVDSLIGAFGPPPADFEPPPPVPPEITEQFTTSVQRTSASVRAAINPHFWSDTRYRVQYGTGKCSEGGCVEEVPSPPGALLTNKVTGSAVKSAEVALEGLEPETTYHYRFVAESGGGPTLGEERSFTTYTLLPAKPCPNDVLRGSSARHLADCRAYEMVSPIDKDNGDIRALINATGYSTAVDQSTPGGTRITYSSHRAFADPKAAPYTSQYIASRDPGAGWSSEAIDVGQSSLGDVGQNLENPYKAFSEDLCQSWLVVKAEPLLAPGAVPHYSEAYRREGCGEESYETLLPATPTVEPDGFNPEVQGTTGDGGAAIVRVKDSLSPEAASGVLQTYYTSEGGLRALCVLPDGTANTGNCSGGTGGRFASFNSMHRTASVHHALSEDGHRAYWTDFGPTNINIDSGPGKIYLRINPGEEQSAIGGGGKCTEAQKACTVAVSGTVTSEPSHFLGASPDGSKALFKVTQGPLAGRLYEFDAETGKSTLIAAKVAGVAGASEDLSRIYLVSEEALSGPNSEGKAPTAGKPNLYLDEEGGMSFVATLAGTDVDPIGELGITSNVTDTSPTPILHAARSTADGGALAFISAGSPTGYDNTDQASGKADLEVYLYEAGAERVVCVSCNPGGARPVGGKAAPPTAASLTLPTTNLYTPRALSSDGQRLFFDSYDALLPRDANGIKDVYEWEAASSKAACEEKGAEAYVASAGGCLSLLSSGESFQASEFIDASADGSDAFFTTAASLLPRDPGLIDLYDARVEGGFPEARVPAPCSGESCLGPVSRPSEETPASSSYEGPEDKAPAKKHKHKKHHKKHKHKKQRRAGR